MSLSNGLKNAGKYKDLIILLDESTSIKVSNDFLDFLFSNIDGSARMKVHFYSYSNMSAI